MKNLYLIIFFIGITTYNYSQCNQYYIYESFSSVLPTQQGTWINTSVLYGSTASTTRTGTHYLTFNAVNDAIRLPLVANPGVLSFYFRRSSTSTGTPKFVVQTSTNGSTWTDRLTLTTFTTSYVLASINLGVLGLTNIHIRIIDLRASGTAERYIEDLALTSTTSVNNTLLLMISASCSQTLVDGDFINITDNGGPSSVGGYSNNVNRTVTITPSDITKQVTLSFFQMDLETGYDSLYVYDGANTSATRILSASGTAIPSSVTASNANGQLTIHWKTDVSNVGGWGGFLIEASIITPLPVELIEFIGIPYPQLNMIEWVTASEHNSDYYNLESSNNGVDWKTVILKDAAGNSNSKIKYAVSHYDLEEITYYRLTQYDFDGKYKTYGPISVIRIFKDKIILKYINLLGQDITPNAETPVFIEVYTDGTTRKVIH